MTQSKPEEVTMKEEKLEHLITEFCEAYDNEDPTAKAWLLQELNALFQQKLEERDKEEIEINGKCTCVYRENGALIGQCLRCTHLELRGNLKGRELMTKWVKEYLETLGGRK